MVPVFYLMSASAVCSSLCVSRASISTPKEKQKMTAIFFFFSKFADINGCLYHLCTFSDTWVLLPLPQRLHFIILPLTSLTSAALFFFFKHPHCKPSFGGMGIQWCRRMLVEIDGGEKKNNESSSSSVTVSLSLAHAHPQSQAAPLSSGPVCVSRSLQAAPRLCFPIHSSIHPPVRPSPISRHLDGGGKAIYSA